MFRRTLLASVGAIALTGSAFAADLPSRGPPPVYLPPPPIFSWTGLYVGINAGYTFGESNSVNSQGSVLATDTGGYGPVLAAGQTGVIPLGNGGGFIGGGQIGYNLQFANTFVAGIEADIQGIASGSSAGNLATLTPAVLTGSVTQPVSTSLSASKRLDYLGTVRGRLGFLITPTLLIYGDGGLAYGGVRANTSITQAILPPPAVPAAVGSPGFTAGTFSNSRVGWTAGGGVEWLFAPNWSVKAEYLYYDLGRVTYSNGSTAFNITPCACGGIGVASAASQSTTRFNGHIVRAGLNYHFNLWGPVVAKF